MNICNNRFPCSMNALKTAHNFAIKLTILKLPVIGIEGAGQQLM